MEQYEGGDVAVSEPAETATENEAKEENERERSNEALPSDRDGNGGERSDCETDPSGDPQSPADPSVDPARQDTDGRALPEGRETFDSARKRAHDELIEFFELFPDVAFADIPRSVRESKLPLAAAYALYERKSQHLRARAEAENRKNLARTAGRVTDGDAGFYTKEEVRRMTRDEVRAEFDAVMRSIRRWK